MVAMMNPKHKYTALENLYRRYESEARPFKVDALCKSGCAFCCTDMGNVDVTTLEALIIHEHLQTLSKPDRRHLAHQIKVNRNRKMQGRKAPCPFLDTHHTCRIYPIRPFSCRQLYSLKPCEKNGAVIHRKAHALAQKTITALKHLDDTGYNGHLTFVLQLLDDRCFKTTYLSGGFDPAAIAAFGKAHGIGINRQV